MTDLLGSHAWVECFRTSLLVVLGVAASSGRTGAQAYGITPDGTRVTFFHDQDLDGVLELYGVPTDGSQAPLMLALARGAGTRPRSMGAAAP